MNPRPVLTIAGREIRSMLASPVAYVVAALASAVFGLFFTSEISGLTEARLDGWFESSSTILLFLAPALAMRSLAEEHRSGSLDVLRAGPVTDLSIVVGKFLGLAAVYLGVLATTLPAPLLLDRWAGTEAGSLLSGYLGLVLLGFASLAIALLASAMTSHQAVAAMLGFVFLLLAWLLQGLGDVFAGSVATVLVRLGSTTHLTSFTRGLIRLEDVVYYLSAIVIGLALAARVTESRRW